jgi:hypothetical protein
MIMEYLTPKEIQKDVIKAEAEFRNTCFSASYYLNVNGLSVDGVRDLLHKSLDVSIDMMVESRDKEQDGK